MDFESIRNSGRLLFESVRGSHLFGLNGVDSDVDTYGIFVGPVEWFLGMGSNRLSYVSSPGNDDSWSEVGKFVAELSRSNPDALAAIFTPQDKILHFNPILQPLWAIRDQLLTKECFKPFSSYAVSQIKKAKGLKKAINIDEDEVKVRKNPTHFSNIVLSDGRCWTLEKWLRETGVDPNHCGLVHSGSNLYTLYYDWRRVGFDRGVEILNKVMEATGEAGRLSEVAKSELRESITRRTSGPIQPPYRGILDPADPLSSQYRSSSVPKGQLSLCTFTYNSQGYSQHCVDYKRYWDWVSSRNENRFNLNKGYDFDSKNMCHCVRLLTCAKEIAEGKGFILDRAGIDKDFLLDIKNHRVSYDELMKYVGELEEGMLDAFNKSNLPDSPDLDLLDKILINIRKNSEFK